MDVFNGRGQTITSASPAIDVLMWICYSFGFSMKAFDMISDGTPVMSWQRTCFDCEFSAEYFRLLYGPTP